jgi:hypothetical protein
LVIGSFNEWDADDVTTYKMAQDGDTYTYTFASLPAATEFKIKEAVAGWDGVTSWGAEGDPSATEAVPVEVTLGTAMNAWAGSGCNFKLSEAQTNVKIVFVKVADGASTLTVTADATQGGDDPVTPSAGFLVIGSFNEWDADDVTTYKMTEEGNNTYSIEMSLTSNTEFKVKEAVAGWDGVTSWGAEGDPSATEALPVEVSVGTAMNAWPGSGCNFLVTENIDQAKITFVYNSNLQEASTITVTRLSSGIEDVNVDANATAVYYNLQGIRVMQPVAGQVYIRNCNGQVSKVLVR